MILTFDVPGLPTPKGSKRHVGGGRMIESAKDLPDWMTVLHTHAKKAMHDAKWATATGPVSVTLRFRILRKPSVRRLLPSVKPDNDKLERAVYDALTIARVINDDALITDNMTIKRYAADGQSPGVWVMVQTLDQSAWGLAG